VVQQLLEGGSSWRVGGGVIMVGGGWRCGVLQVCEGGQLRYAAPGC
jgi:hypothetical protein